jgi:hypothetical protein
MIDKVITQRSENSFLEVTLVCPKHWVQKVYDLANKKGQIRGVGCVECFKHLPIIN